MDLLQQINKETNEQQVREDTITSNLNLLAESEECGVEELHEAATQWLAKLNDVVSKGNLSPEKKQSAAFVLAALMALSKPEFADALDEKGDLGTVLYTAGGTDAELSKRAFNRLIEIGRTPSVSKAYAEQASQALEDSAALSQTISQIQRPLDQIMTKKISAAKQKQAAPSTEQSPRLGIKRPAIDEPVV